MFSLKRQEILPFDKIYIIISNGASEMAVFYVYCGDGRWDDVI